MKEDYRKLARDAGFAPEAMAFLLEALEHAIELSGKAEAQGADRHITGQELLRGLRQHALRVFGPLAVPAWRAWGIRASIDWGRVVFLLVEAGYLNRQETDTLADFDEEFDEEEFFVRQYRPRLELADEAERARPWRGAEPGGGGGEPGA